MFIKLLPLVIIYKVYLDTSASCVEVGSFN